MLNRKHTAKALAALASISLVVAACGSDENTTPAPVATTPEAPAPTEAMEDETVDTEAMEEPADTEAMEEPVETDAMEDSDSPSFGPACSSIPADGEGSLAGMTDDPAATAASNNPLLTTLVAAVGEAGLVDTLNSDGPFTIFAPANPAFEALGEDAVAAVLADEELLTSILTYHVIAGESLNAEGLGAAGSAVTVNGAELTFSADGTAVNGVDVLCSDIVTANATVHVIGEVLMPS